MSDDVTHPLRALSWDQHKSWSWRRPDNYGFAKQWQSVPVTLQEAVSAASCFPIVFARDLNGILPQALLRRGPSGQSAFIGPERQWQAAWLPPRVAAWPFGLVSAPANQYALAFDAQSDLVGTDGEGFAFFQAVPGKGKELGLETRRMAMLLRAHADGLPATLRATAALDGQGLLTPLGSQDDLFVISDEAALQVGEADMIRLYRAGAMELLYAARVSYAHMPWMERAEQYLCVEGPFPLALAKQEPKGARFLAALSDAFTSNEPAFRLP